MSTLPVAPVAPTTTARLSDAGNDVVLCIAVSVSEQVASSASDLVMQKCTQSKMGTKLGRLNI